ncbi:MAG TPA: hypothetical protein VNG71_22030 [Pyrinomonadaceae bacterium]|nr:hypothetical protein [Pyrinomonadaceae bacterium]
MIGRRCSRKLIGSLIAVMVFCFSAVCKAQTSDIDKAKTLQAARERYYNLRTLGLSDVQVAIQPNWDLLLEGTNPAPNARTLLNNLHFWISIDAAGKLQLSHDAKAVPVDQLEAVEKIFKGVNSSVTGFFRTWSIFLLSSPFPAPGSDYAVERRANGFRFLQRQNDLDVAIDTDNEFAVTEISAVAVDRTSSLKPILEKTPAGLVLKGYTASSQRPDGSNTTVQASLEYETVRGLRMLHKVNLDTLFQGASAKFEWVFTDYQVKLR